MRLRSLFAAIVVVLCAATLPAATFVIASAHAPAIHHVTFRLSSGTRQSPHHRTVVWARMMEGHYGVAGARVTFRLSQHRLAVARTDSTGMARAKVKGTARQGTVRFVYRSQGYRLALNHSAKVNGDPRIRMSVRSQPFGAITPSVVSISSGLIAYPGEEMFVSGTGFAPQEPIYIYLDNPNTIVGLGVADSSGNLSPPAPNASIPFDATAAQHSSGVVGESSHTGSINPILIETSWQTLLARTDNSLSGTRDQNTEHTMSADRMANGLFFKLSSSSSPCLGSATSDTGVVDSQSTTDYQSLLLAACTPSYLFRFLDTSAGLGTAIPSLEAHCSIPSGPVVSTPTSIFGAAYFFGSDDHDIYGYKINSSSTCAVATGFPVTTGGRVRATPTIGENVSLNGALTVVVPSEDGKLYQVCLGSTGCTAGSESPGFPVIVGGGAPIDASPTFDVFLTGGASTVGYIATYVASTDGHLYAYNDDTGAPLAGYTAPAAGGPIYSSPVSYDGSIYFGSDDNKLYCVNAVTGAIRWTAATSGAIRSTPAIADGIVYITSRDNHLYAFDAATGTLKWKQLLPVAADTSSLATPFNSSPAVADGIVYVGGTDGGLYALNAGNGALIQGFPRLTGGPIFSSPAITQDSVFVGSNDGGMYVLIPAQSGLPSPDGPGAGSPAASRGLSHAVSLMR